MKRKIIKAVITCLTLLIAVMPTLGGTAVNAEEITYLLDACDSGDNWTTNNFPDQTNYIMGTGSLYSRSVVASLNAVFRNIDTSKLPPYKDAYLEMYVYFSDVSNISTGPGHAQIELNSSGINDNCEIFYNFVPHKIEMQSGWNFISLKLSDFDTTDGKFVYSNLRGMRLYAISKDGKPNELRLDHITITNAPKYEQIKQSGFTVKSTPYAKIDFVVDETIYEGKAREVLEGGEAQ